MKKQEPLIEAAPPDRHTLVVEADGMTYIEHIHPFPYDAAGVQVAKCFAVQAGWEHFYTQVHIPDLDGPTLPAIMAAGRFWCSVDDDGIFEIGARQ